MITRNLVAALGAAQLVLWGVTYYLVGVLGDAMAADLGWSRTAVHGGFALALVVMGLASAPVGRAVDRLGGARIMTAGSLLAALGCAGLAATAGPISYLAAWACLGLAMRMTLYEAAFAALVRIGGGAARPAISQITLLGGLASTVFWPIGATLADVFGWRGAALGYALFALATVPIHRAIPDTRAIDRPAEGAAAPAPRAATPRDFRIAALLYGTGVTVTSFLAAGLSAHMIGMIAGLGLAAGLAVWLSTLRGIGQSAARLAEVLLGARTDPLRLGTLAAALLPLGFMVGLLGGVAPLAAAVFALAYGAGNGLLTIVRGTQPLVLFDPRTYGALVGRLMTASFFVSAVAPVAYAAVIDAYGAAAALIASAVLGCIGLACSAAMLVRFGRTD
ncbi:MFS transporter [Rhodoplanes sp. TEM]|uniref:MFS transporter n=1 Tax=Rhodoplanes tepidamans TaxID=200616 RepID=A0ABT5J6B1_RHOTP|nr:MULTISPECIES: MFS transporter [Rhodoplanes]MDC7785176.1 MFS transporter [Rhodoplanes tepidamans]MDC7987126.1 MFS transporter [Rhodoplanes sp. TEM]MDQ0353433.1 MFS family permease [Rhodoplanes tepidamans]